MTAEPDETPEGGQPPREVLYALYLLFAVVLVAVLIVVGVYGT
jgi:hypothetical protein